MDRKIRVAAVSYLNTKPLIYGLSNTAIEKEIELRLDYPAKIADMLVNDKVDLSLIPVAEINRLPESHIVTDYCIGAEGPVASVCLFADCSIAEIETIFLDYQSRSSVALLKLLLREHWKISPEVLRGEAGYENNIAGRTAALVIGDRAFAQRKKHPFIYDLAEEWQQLTGLPFVFAAWVANKKLPSDFLTRFNQMTGEGLRHLPEIILANPYPDYDLYKYYTENISFELTPTKREGLKLFLEMIR